jgi:hypothetical protein
LLERSAFSHTRPPHCHDESGRMECALCTTAQATNGVANETLRCWQCGVFCWNPVVIEIRIPSEAAQDRSFVTGSVHLFGSQHLLGRLPAWRFAACNKFLSRGRTILSQPWWIQRRMPPPTVSFSTTARSQEAVPDTLSRRGRSSEPAPACGTVVLSAA